jgi:hypothetical protein
VFRDSGGDWSFVSSVRSGDARSGLLSDVFVLRDEAEESPMWPVAVDNGYDDEELPHT